MNTLGMFFALLVMDNKIINFGEDESEDECTDNIRDPVHLGENAPHASERDEYNHDEF